MPFTVDLLSWIFPAGAKAMIKAKYIESWGLAFLLGGPFLPFLQAVHPSSSRCYLVVLRPELSLTRRRLLVAHITGTHTQQQAQASQGVHSLQR